MSWRIGLAPGAAREKVRVARALADLPLLSDAMRRAVISYSKVRAVTRVATPETEQTLLDLALAGTAAHVEQVVRAWRRVDRTAEAADDRRRHASRVLHTWVDDDGMVVIRGRLAPEVGAVVRRALEAALDEQRRAAAPPEPGVPDPVDEEAGGIHVSAATAQRLACDAARVEMLHGPDGQVLDVGRKTRTNSPALRRALAARDRQCRFPGCQARRCDAHHIRHWARGGAIALDNLVLLCRRHHRAVHEEGFRVTVGPSGAVRAAGRKAAARNAAGARLDRRAARSGGEAIGGSRDRYRRPHRHAGLAG